MNQDFFITITAIARAKAVSRKDGRCNAVTLQWGTKNDHITLMLEVSVSGQMFNRAVVIE